MKLTQIALATGLLAMVGFASAQSNVTLYGVADIGLTKITGQKAQLLSSGTQNNGTSRWGMRGNEDLGGGLNASFNFEARCFSCKPVRQAGQHESGWWLWYLESGPRADAELVRCDGLGADCFS